ncbi:hypothetical protein FPOAC1_003629 [Fusarium poae]|uniref:hypothetical protein n=1 Tax=Fusarium poae TaxID=36050 RepID=UPI001CE95F8C|nr:hypothetical protein FPOAC1_003629 [Fusarium poae]KAG8677605.1 hypothetical protein FPOAC1_003629 [Fusarium poae]
MMLRTKSPVLENIVRSLLNAIDVVPTMQSAQENNMKIIVEGANASMLDLDVGSYSYVTTLNLTKLDVLDIFETVKMTMAYKDPGSGEELASYPADLGILGRDHVV